MIYVIYVIDVIYLLLLGVVQNCKHGETDTLSGPLSLEVAN